MSYTGLVTPGGAADVRTLAGLTIRKVSVGDMDNCCYLLTCADTGRQLLIDAAADPARLTALLEEGTGRLDAIVTTHQHFDHTRALKQLAGTTKATTYAGADDAPGLPLPPHHTLRHGDRITVGDQTLDVIHLRGHTPGSVALAWTEPGGSTHLFTGDSLFPGGVGNTRGDAAKFRQLFDDVSQRLFGVYGDNTWVYPGHGADTTLGAERPALPQWRERGW